MSIVAINEIGNGRGGKATADSVREYTRVFRVITSDPLIGTPTVGSAPGLPRLYTPYIDPAGVIDYGSICISVDPKQDADNPQIWEVTIEYSSRLNRRQAELARAQNGSGAGGHSGGSGSGSGGSIDDPLSRPPKVSGDAIEYMEPFLVDLDGEPLLNSCGERPETPPERPNAYQVIRIEKNYAVVDENLYALYANVINSDPYRGNLPGNCLMKPIRWQSAYENGLYFYTVNFEIHINPEGWDYWLIDSGFTHLAEIPGKPTVRVVMTDWNGVVYPTPQLLDGNGQKLPKNGDPVYYKYKKFESRPFAALNLPNI